MLVAPDVIAPDDKLEDGNGNKDDGAIDESLDAGVVLVQAVAMMEIIVDRQYYSYSEGRHNDIDIGVHKEGINGVPFD